MTEQAHRQAHAVRGTAGAAVEAAVVDAERVARQAARGAGVEMSDEKDRDGISGVRVVVVAALGG